MDKLKDEELKATAEIYLTRILSEWTSPIDDNIMKLLEREAINKTRSLLNNRKYREDGEIAKLYTKRKTPEERAERAKSPGISNYMQTRYRVNKNNECVEYKTVQKYERKGTLFDRLLAEKGDEIYEFSKTNSKQNTQKEFGITYSMLQKILNAKQQEYAEHLTLSSI